MFIDSDIQFEARDAVTMVLDKDGIGAPYAKKFINWEKVKKAVVHNPQIPANELKQVGGTTTFTSVTKPVTSTCVNRWFVFASTGFSR